MRKELFSFIILILSLITSINGQNLGIGPDTFDPDASAGVEMRFTNKGLLIPRLTLAQRNAIPSPATSLLIYQTDNTPGYYYNAGTPASPNWIRLATTGLDGSGTATRVAFWSGTNTLSYNDYLSWDNTNSRLGVGTSVPGAKLDIKDHTDAGIMLYLTDDNNTSGETDHKAIQVQTQGVVQAWLSTNGNAYLSNNLGIGTTTPSAKLHVVTSASQPLAYFYQSYDNYMYLQDISATELLYAYRIQKTSVGDGQATIYGYRTRDSQNDGTGYGNSASNGAVKGYNLWGDLYSYGVGGFNWNDYNRCGGVLGSVYTGSYWASLGYKNSANNTFGVYYTNNGSGSGYSSIGGAMAGVGAGGYGDMLGVWSRGEVMGAIFSGELFSTYNLGNTYTSGTQVELVKTNNEKTPAYTMTSTKVKIYADGLGYLSGTEIFISYDNNFKKLLGDTTPIITITPIGKSANLYIKSIDKDGFIVACDTPQDIQFSWIAVGTRIDNKEVQRVPEELTDINFDNNLVDFMFNENIKERSAKAMWWDGSRIQFGKLPEFFYQADREAKQAELEKMKQLEENNNIKIDTEKKSK